MGNQQLAWYEFFAGGGMARLGLGERWQCTFANEWSEKKAGAYRAHFGPSPELAVADIASLTAADLPGEADLAWASFPCQDLSLAGKGQGLKGDRSGTFRAFQALLERITDQNRSPQVVVLENVVGALTSHQGRDFEVIIGCLADLGHRVGALVIDAARFVPQSRPRLFVVATLASSGRQSLESDGPVPPWHTTAIQQAHDRLPNRLRRHWVWWNLPLPKKSPEGLSSLIEDPPAGIDWHAPSETKRLLSLMSEVNRKKVTEAKKSGVLEVGTVYRRTRSVVGLSGERRKMQRAEVRFDDVSGCLRTPAGGSSRQIVLLVEGKRVRSRLLSAREAARLMGVPEDYPVPSNYNEAYHLFGDGLVVPVVSWLEKHLLRPLAESRPKSVRAA